MDHFIENMSALIYYYVNNKVDEKFIKSEKPDWIIGNKKGLEVVTCEGFRKIDNQIRTNLENGKGFSSLRKKLRKNPIQGLCLYIQTFDKNYEYDVFHDTINEIHENKRKYDSLIQEDKIAVENPIWYGLSKKGTNVGEKSIIDVYKEKMEKLNRINDPYQEVDTTLMIHCFTPAISESFIYDLLSKIRLCNEEQFGKMNRFFSIIITLNLKPVAPVYKIEPPYENENCLIGTIYGLKPISKFKREWTSISKSDMENACDCVVSFEPLPRCNYIL